MLDVIQMVGAAVVALMGVIGVRVMVYMSQNAVRLVREVREEGGGVAQKARGELARGQGKPSTARAHGLHMTVRGGRVVYRRKSVIANEVL